MKNKTTGNSSLEKFYLLQQYKEGKIAGDKIGEMILAIDEKYRTKSEKIFRFIGQCLFGWRF